jgi:hypothetical protein
MREREREKAKTLDDDDTTGSPGNLTVNRSVRAGLKEGADVAVGEDHRGGTVSEESDVTSTALGRKGTRSTVRLFGTNSLKEGAV